MLPKMKLFAVTILIAFLTAAALPHKSFAEDTGAAGIATYFTVSGTHIEDGDIVSSSGNQNVLSSTPYDISIVGVVTMKPAIALKSIQAKGYPLVTFGTAYTKVSGENGTIKKGDFITSSEVPGVGMKAVKTGYVVGQALNNASFSGKNDVKLIAVNINVHFIQFGSTVSSSLFDIFKLGTVATYEEPLRVFQYITAAFVLIASFVFGFLIFAKAVNTGIEALGRNPLAGKMIQLSIVFNVILVIIIVMTGVGIAYLLLRL